MNINFMMGLIKIMFNKNNSNLFKVKNNNILIVIIEKAALHTTNPKIIFLITIKKNYLKEAMNKFTKIRRKNLCHFKTKN